MIWAVLGVLVFLVVSWISYRRGRRADNSVHERAALLPSSPASSPFRVPGRRPGRGF